MTKEEIAKLAKEAGFIDSDDNSVWITDGFWTVELERFAALVAAAERKRICKQIAQLHDSLSMASNPLITPRGSLGEEV